MWFLIGKYRVDDYEEVLEACHSFSMARDLGRDYAPWFGDEWDIIIRHQKAMTGKECWVHEINYGKGKNYEDT